jgi:hypothetical protein
MEKFFAYVSVNGRLDTSMVRVFVDELQIFDLLSRYPNASVLRPVTNQIALVLPESDRLIWVDALTKDLQSLHSQLESYASLSSKKIQGM